MLANSGAVIAGPFLEEVRPVLASFQPCLLQGKTGDDWKLLEISLGGIRGDTEEEGRVFKCGPLLMPDQTLIAIAGLLHPIR